MESGKIDYPLSTGYRKEWGDWEAVREIMQNAFDSDGEVKMDFEDNTLTIQDSGNGFSLRHLLIGESEKDGVETIGKFGEGLKFALLTLLRQNRDTLVRSNGLILKPELHEMFGVQTMRITYKSASRPIKGTQIKVRGLEKSYRDRFLSLSKEENFVSRPLLDQPGKLYIKGIYVTDIEAITGYNLKIERENPLSGSVDSWKVNDAIEELITQTDNREYIEKLLRATRLDPKKHYNEFDCGSWRSGWVKNHKELWAEIVENVFGKKVCRSTNPIMSREAEYRGFRVIDCPANFLKGTIDTDIEAVMMDTKDDFFEHDFESLSDKEKENIRRACYFIYTVFYKKLPLQIGDFKDSPNTLGTSLGKKFIRLAYKIVANFDQLYETLIHEFVHYEYGYMDLTPEFQEYLGRTHGRIAHFLGNNKVDIPNNFNPFK